MSDTPVCVLERYRSNGDSSVGKLVTAIVLSHPDAPNVTVTDISRSYKVNAVEMPILTKSSKNKYIMDMGNVETITLTVSRVAPEVVNDDIDINYLTEGVPLGADTVTLEEYIANRNKRIAQVQAQWSNAKWMKWIKDSVDQWQNYNRNIKNEWTGGYTLRYTPTDLALQPVLEKNVFISNRIEFDYGFAITGLTITLTVATMLVDTADAKSTYLQFQYTRTDGLTGSFVMHVSRNHPARMPPIPVDADNRSRYWYCETARFSPNQTYAFSEWSRFMYDSGQDGQIIILKLKEVSRVFVFTDTTSNISLAPTGLEESEITVFAVGGGAGSNFGFSDAASGEYYNVLPGGGGAGQATSRTFSLASSATFDVTIGDGGSGAYTYKSGGWFGTSIGEATKIRYAVAGGDTKVAYNNTMILSASGGQPPSGGLSKDGGVYGGGESSNHYGNGGEGVYIIISNYSQSDLENNKLPGINGDAPWGTAWNGKPGYGHSDGRTVGGGCSDFNLDEYIPEYDDSVTYVTGQVVKYGSGTYRYVDNNLVDHPSERDPGMSVKWNYIHKLQSTGGTYITDSARTGAVETEAYYGGGAACSSRSSDSHSGSKNGAKGLVAIVFYKGGIN